MMKNLYSGVQQSAQVDPDIALCAVYSIPCRNEGCMVDALASRSDEGRGMAAICSGEMPNNRYIPRSPNEETHLLTAGTLV
jgi:hypothetical protein